MTFQCLLTALIYNPINLYFLLVEGQRFFEPLSRTVEKSQKLAYDGTKIKGKNTRNTALVKWKPGLHTPSRHACNGVMFLEHVKLGNLKSKKLQKR